MKRLIVVEWEDSPGMDEAACDHLQVVGNELMTWLVDQGYVDPAISMEPSTLTDAMRWYADNPSFNLDGGRRARLALGEGNPTDLQWQKERAHGR